ncbi:MAG TPA: hypothetical protein VFV47_07315 [Hyphomicrobiaceae bacterium]|jgi:hypothetical protein|nr:hypothetical protein [Hyphomicrobiaceae bacterium]
MAGDTPELRIDIDLGHAEREAERVRRMLEGLRRRHDLGRFEYTRIVQIVPAGPTHSHPILTLGTRFADSEDQLLATYLHEQMHWYLWRLGGPDHDPVEPFFDELVRRYPKAPTRLPEGGRNYEQTYLHLVVCWLEINITADLIGEERAFALCDTQWGYRWIYQTVRRDREAIGALLAEHGILPLLSPADLDRADAERSRAARNGARSKPNGRSTGRATALDARPRR